MSSTASAAMSVEGTLPMPPTGRRPPRHSVTMCHPLTLPCENEAHPLRQQNEWYLKRLPHPPHFLQDGAFQQDVTCGWFTDSAGSRIPSSQARSARAFTTACLAAADPCSDTTSPQTVETPRRRGQLWPASQHVSSAYLSSSFPIRRASAAPAAPRRAGSRRSLAAPSPLPVGISTATSSRRISSSQASRQRSATACGRV